MKTGACGGRRVRDLVPILGMLVPVGLPAQILPESYRVAGVDVPLELYTDSLALVTIDELTGTEVAAMAAQALGETVGIRALDRRAWVVGFSQRTRSVLHTLVATLRGDDRLHAVGLVVRLPGAEEPAIVTAEVLVRFRSGVSRAVVDSLSAAVGAEVIGDPALAADLFLVRSASDPPRDGLELAADYLTHPGVLYAHPNFWLGDRPSDFFPNDPLFSDQWHLYNPGASVPVGAPRPDIHAPEAWDITQGDSKVTIAILEQGGFDTGHPDLANRLWRNPWMTGTGSGPEPFNKSGDLNGWNFDGCPTTSDPATDPCGTPDLAFPGTPVGTNDHGTQVAGVASAEGDNGIGVSGVCPDCRVMLVRIGFTTAYVRASAVAYARAMGADVINMSFNTQYNDDTFIDAVAGAATEGRGNRGITIVAAPFDYSFDENICGSSPPLLAGQSTVISVIMSNAQDERQLGAMGPCLDLMSPGVGIWTTTVRGRGPSGTPDYASVDGNSFGAPVVAGVAGLLLSRNYDLTRDQIFDILTSTADKVDSGGYGSDGHSDTHGYGRVNAYRALQAVPEVTGTTGTPTAPPSGPEVGVRVGLTVLGGGATDRFVGVPGQGPLGAPVVYGTFFPGSFLLDLQLGYAHRWGGSPPTERRLHGALMVAYGYSFGSASLYAGPSGAVRSVDIGGTTTTETGIGAAVGVRKALASYLALRLETSYRWWGGPGLNEWGLGVGFGVRLP